jgi:hypothetical protein
MSITLPPSAQNSFAVAAPIPEPPPVISATLPATLFMLSATFICGPRSART